MSRELVCHQFQQVDVPQVVAIKSVDQLVDLLEGQGAQPAEFGADGGADLVQEVQCWQLRMWMRVAVDQMTVFEVGHAVEEHSLGCGAGRLPQ